MTLPKKLFIASLVFGLVVSAAMTAFYFFYHLPRIKLYERVETFLERMQEHEDTEFDYKLTSIEYEAAKRLLDLYTAELTYREDMAVMLPEFELEKGVTEYRQLRDEQAKKVSYLGDKLDLTRAYLASLEHFLVLTCVDFSFSEAESAKVITHQMSKEEVLWLLQQKGVIE